MRWQRLLVPILLPAFLACEGPTALLPGGALSGPVEPVPESFAFARDAGTVQLETRPDDPYSVNVASAIVGGDVYVSAGSNRSRWVENMESDPRVRLRIAGVIYELRAERVTDAAALDAFAEEWLKNSWARDPRSYDEVFVYRLLAR
jgi:hypothetical protein